MQEALDTARGRTIDIAESVLFSALLKREPWAITFVLRTLGKHRGYVEKQVVENVGPGGGPVVTVDASALAKLSEAELEQYEQLVKKIAAASDVSSEALA